MNEEKLKEYYNKFNEDKRLTRRHGQVEYQTSLRFISKYLQEKKTVLDIGAGSGRYAKALVDAGYDVTAVELVKHNLQMIRQKDARIRAYEGNALDLSFLKGSSYDLILLFGPLYHLQEKEEKIKALLEAKKHLADDGVLMAAFYMNDYALLIHGFRDGFFLKDREEGLIDEAFHIRHDHDGLYSFSTLQDIAELERECGFSRVGIFAADGPSDYMRPVINKMDEETFSAYLEYHFQNCEREDLLGASSHVVDILMK